MSDLVNDTNPIQSEVNKVSWELMETYESLSTIYNSAHLLAVSDSVVHAADTTLKCSIDTSESNGGAVFIPRDDGQEAVSSDDFDEEIRKEALSCMSRHGDRAFYEDNPPEGVLSGSGKAVRSYLYVPFVMGDNSRGMVFLFSTSEREYTSIEVKRVQTLACQGALAIRCLLQLEDLAHKNRSLRNTLEQLSSAQGELVKAERLSSMGQMASMIVHDIKNPIGGLLGYAQLLETMADSLAPDDIREYSGVIIKEMIRLSNMTEDIMDFSRGTGTSLDLRELTPRDLVAAAVPVIKADLKENGIKLSWDGLDDESVLMADSDKMARVFINMAVNARLAMNDGGRFSISSDVMDGYVECSLRDNGNGIPPEIRDKIFEPFVSKRNKQGLGLGLAVSRWIVNAHGGKVWVHSSGDYGTDIRVRIPLITDDGKQAAGTR